MNFTTMKQQQWKVNTTYELGSKKFSESEIIEFAKVHDPLDFHIDLEAAKKSRFKGLVCSGGQAFYHFYPKVWVPFFGDTVIAGMGLKDWNFLAPIYVNEMINAKCSIQETINREIKEEIIVVWYFEFFDKNNKLLQNLTLTVLHKN